MSVDRRQFIATLASSAGVARSPGRIGVRAVLWLTAAAAFAIAATRWAAPFRPGFLADFSQTPLAQFEFATGVAAVAALAVAAFRSGIPAPGSMLRRAWPALGLLALWFVAQAAALFDATAVVSMLGKRSHCWLEVMGYGVPALLAGCVAVRRLWPLKGAWSGTLLGLAAGTIGALVMQFACMDAPVHAMAFHVLPGLALGAVGAVAGHFLIGRR
ncbi:MAG: NrsF family protein [Gammaproteobacteria bacterium]